MVNEGALHLRTRFERRDSCLFLPLVYRLAARLEQISWEELADDPSSSTYAIRAAQRLFHLPVVVTHFRVGAEAEACGANLGRDSEGDWETPIAPADPPELDAGALERPPLAQLLDVTRRLGEELRGTAATVAVLSGPRTLSALFSSPPTGLGQFYASLARAYAERGVQALLVVEDPRHADKEAHGDPVLAPMLNVASYFRLPTVLLDAARTDAIPGFTLTLGGPGNQPTLPLSALEGPPEAAENWRERAHPLLLTEWEVPAELPAEQLVAWTAALADA